jgi:hypothetical protein
VARGGVWRERGGVSNSGAVDTENSEVQILVPRHSTVRAVLFVLRREYDALQCGGVVSSVEEVDTKLENVDILLPN